MSRRSKIVIVNLIAAAMLLAVAEIILRVADSGYDTPGEYSDPQKNPDKQVRFEKIFHNETIEGREMLVTRLDSEYERIGIDDTTRRFLTFPAKKPASTIRIFILGSSPVWGAYHEDPAQNTLFSWQLEKALEKILGKEAERFEIVNAAHVGFGGPEVIRSCREVVQYQPDLIVIYNGGVMPLIDEGFRREDLGSSSAFFGVRKALNSLRLFQLVEMMFSKPMEMDQRPAHPSAPIGEILPPGNPQKDSPGLPVETGPDGIPSFTQGGGRLVQPAVFLEQSVNLVRNLIRITQDDYRQTYEQTFEPAARTNTPVIACTVATNIAGIPPFWSLHWKQLPENQLKVFTKYYESGRDALANNNFEAARENLAAAIAISPTFADAHFLYAKVLEHFGEMEKAKEHYHLAKEYDASNERALDRPNEILREVAAKYGFNVLDSEAAIAALDPHGIIGDKLFIDHQHPNGQALAALADAVAGKTLKMIFRNQD
jgi:Tetratricopeptide repeat